MNRAGEVLAAKYRLEELLGSGGMGDVYRAVNQLVGRTVAIKLLKPEHAENAQVVERFLREARTANLVRHPNVVDVIDIGQDENGSPFIVQELLKGEDLSRYAARHGGKLSLDEIVAFLCPVIDAVAEAHAAGVIHRDIKPDNVFLADNGAARIPKLLDFGISQVRSPNVRATEVGVMMGTPAYMAPEQVQGAREADARSDVWALGVMLFELLAGRLPFDAIDAPALFVAIATTDAPRLVDIAPEIPRDVSTVVERCLRRVASERYPSAAELARDLRHVIDGTELEPTAKRSIPPAALNIPDLELPKIERPKPPTPAPAPPPPKPRIEEAPARSAKPESYAMQGVGIAPSTRQPMPPPASHKTWSPHDEPKSRARVDTTAFVGFVVVALIVIVIVGGLMQLVHRTDGWPIAQFLAKPPKEVNAAVQIGLALAAFAIGAAYARRAVKHWRGDLSGGPTGAILGAIGASAAFFAAVELVSAAW